MKKSFRKTNKSHKKYGKKGGIFPFTRTSKYRDMKGQRATLEETVGDLERELAECERKVKECIEKYPGQYPISGGVFGLSLASNYKAVKSEKLGLEQRATELRAAIETCNEKLLRCETLTQQRHEDWKATMDAVADRGNEARDMQERVTEERITPFSQEEFERTQELNRQLETGGRRRKTKKISRKRKGSRRRR
jgi:hypothetical protein